MATLNQDAEIDQITEGLTAGREDDLSELASACRLLVGGGNFREELKGALVHVARTVRAATLTVILRNESTGKLEVVAEYQAPGARIPRRSMEIGKQVIKQGITVTVSNSSARAPGDANMILRAMPIEAEQKTIGALSATLSGDAQQSERAIDLLQFVVPMIAQSVRVARLVEGATQRMLDDDARLREELSRRYDFSRLVGNCGPMRQICEQIAQVAPSNATVLIQGESGTGKELIAHAVHVNSHRADKPFVRVNCGALPEELIEAELFGAERGAFTDAVARKAGRFEIADGGTLFLDEIGELSLGAQIKLLRVLQSGEYERLGGTETLAADVRVIAATNRNLEKEIAAKRFREDLYYRLNVFTIISPPLRDRRDDIQLLAEHFLRKYAGVHGIACSLSTTALALLKAYNWPGNVRELENVIERSVIVCGGDVIHHYHLPAALQALRKSARPSDQSLSEAVEAYERELLCDSLKHTLGNRNQAAKLLKISERLLTYKVKKYHIDCNEFRR